MLTFADVANVIINLSTLSIAVGWILACLIQPYRDLASYLFVALCVSASAWVSISLLIATEASNIAPLLLLRIQVTAMGLTVAMFYYFTTFYLIPKGRIAGFLTTISPALLIISFIIIWTRDFIVPDENIIRPEAYLLIAFSLAFACISFGVVLSSDQQVSNRLVLPAVLMILAYIVNAFDPLRITPLDRLFLMLSITLTGWTLIREQVFNPLERLNTELRTTNRGLQAVINDLASEKSKTEELNRELIITNQYKSEFLANISHELRTPLNSIIGYSELLHNGVYGQLSDKQHDRVEKIYRNGMELLSLISNILDLNKIDAGKMELNLTQFGVSTVLETLQAEYQAKAEQKGLIFSVDLPMGVPYLYGDSTRIQQIIRNLLDNAVKFTKQGSVNLNVASTQVKNGHAENFKLPALGWLRDGAWVIISVQDTGIGIPTEHQSRIFDEFSQVDGSHTREHGGSGLGLAICRRLVEMHSGIIWLQSTQEQGSTFLVALPADIKPIRTSVSNKESER